MSRNPLHHLPRRLDRPPVRVRDDLVLVDRNCHKSILHAIIMTGAIPIYLTGSRNDYGIIGPIAHERFSGAQLAEQIANQVKKAIANDEAMLEEGEQQLFEGLLNDLAEAMQGRDRQRISALSHQIDEVTAPFAQRRIERDLELAIQGKAATEVAKELGVSK